MFFFKGFLRPAEEAKSSHIPARVPPYDDFGILVVLPQVFTRRAGRSYRLLKFLCTHRHVLVLFDRRTGPAVQEVPMVEEVHDLDPTGNAFLVAIVQPSAPRSFIQTATMLNRIYLS